MNAGTAEIVGILKLKMYHMEFTKMFRHPKYYKELRRRNKETQQEPQRILDKPGRSVSNSDQAISLTLADGCNGSVRPDPGHKLQAASTKPQASSAKLRKHQATSLKPQAASVKLQATSVKLHDS